MTNGQPADSEGRVFPVFEAPDDASSASVASDTSAAEDGPSATDTAPSRNADDDIPLNIAGHEDRERPDAAEGAADLLGEDASEDGDAVDRGEGGGADGGEGSDGADSEKADGDQSEDEEEEVEPVEVLVGLADAGEIDPWDIDVVRVTDKFLDAMDEADLRTSGRALFYASVLIRMKSDAMLSPDEPDEPEEPWQESMQDDAPIEGMDPFTSLESEMERRLERKRARGMPQTLDELVRDLREAERESWWKESRTYDTSGSPEGFQRGTQQLDYRAADDLRMDDEPTEDDVTGTTHAEDIDRIIENVYDAVREQYDAGRSEVLFREVSSAGGSRVETYLGLLFLAHRNRVQLQQDDIFGDLWIQDPSAATGSEEALAD